MKGTLIKQPNGKYCIVDYDGEVERYNLTEQGIVDMYIEDAKKYIETAENYGNLIAKTVRYNGTLNGIHDDMLEAMGFDKSYDELVKFVPRKPTNQSYAHCDFTTYAKCPSCDEVVTNGMGHTDDKCRKCGQLLEWK
jgi:hypothetical protein